MNLVETKEFGQLPDGTLVHSYQLENKMGMKITFLSYGAVMQSFILPGSEDLDIVLGFDNLEDYLTSMNMENPPYFGTMVGRFAGRIREGSFVLNQQLFQLTQNHGVHHLHGGKDSFSRAIWTAEPQISTQQLTFHHVSPAGTDGYPGELHSKLTYRLTEDGQLIMDFKATSTEDTIINVTQHHYWNLAGHHSSVESQEIRLNATHYLEKNKDQIPTGDFVLFDEKPFQSELSAELREKLDHTFVISDNQQIQATLTHPTNGWKMQVKSNQAAAHLFIGCALPPNLLGKSGNRYHAKSGVCFEMQNFPDAPNQEHFPSCILRKGATYENTTIFHFENQAYV